MAAAARGRGRGGRGRGGAVDAPASVAAVEMPSAAGFRDGSAVNAAEDERRRLAALAASTPEQSRTGLDSDTIALLTAGSTPAPAPASGSRDSFVEPLGGFAAARASLNTAAPPPAAAPVDSHGPLGFGAVAESTALQVARTDAERRARRGAADALAVSAAPPPAAAGESAGSLRTRSSSGGSVRGGVPRGGAHGVNGGASASTAVQAPPSTVALAVALSGVLAAATGIRGASSDPEAVKRARDRTTLIVSSCCLVGLMSAIAAVLILAMSYGNGATGGGGGPAQPSASPFPSFTPAPNSSANASVSASVSASASSTSQPPILQSFFGIPEHFVAPNGTWTYPFSDAGVVVDPVHNNSLLDLQVLLQPDTSRALRGPSARPSSSRGEWQRDGLTRAPDGVWVSNESCAAGCLYSLTQVPVGRFNLTLQQVYLMMTMNSPGWGNMTGQVRVVAPDLTSLSLPFNPAVQGIPASSTPTPTPTPSGSPVAAPDFYVPNNGEIVAIVPPAGNTTVFPFAPNGGVAPGRGYSGDLYSVRLFLSVLQRLVLASNNGSFRLFVNGSEGLVDCTDVCIVELAANLTQGLMNGTVRGVPMIAAALPGAGNGTWGGTVVVRNERTQAEGVTPVNVTVVAPSPAPPVPDVVVAQNITGSNATEFNPYAQAGVGLVSPDGAVPVQVSVGIDDASFVPDALALVPYGSKAEVRRGYFGDTPYTVTFANQTYTNGTLVIDLGAMPASMVNQTLAAVTAEVFMASPGNLTLTLMANITDPASGESAVASFQAEVDVLRPSASPSASASPSSSPLPPDVDWTGQGAYSTSVGNVGSVIPPGVTITSNPPFGFPAGDLAVTLTCTNSDGTAVCGFEGPGCVITNPVCKFVVPAGGGKDAFLAALQNAYQQVIYPGATPGIPVTVSASGVTAEKNTAQLAMTVTLGGGGRDVVTPWRHAGAGAVSSADPRAVSTPVPAPGVLVV